MEDVQINILHFRLIFFNLKMFDEIVTLKKIPITINFFVSLQCIVCICRVGRTHDLLVSRKDLIHTAVLSHWPKIKSQTSCFKVNYYFKAVICSGKIENSLFQYTLAWSF